MAEKSNPANENRPPDPVWGKRIGVGAAALVFLVLVAYFVGTSSAFIKGVVLPRAGTSMNAKITAEAVELSPFSQLVIRQLRVQTIGDKPLFEAQEIRARYSLVSILKGNMVVSEVAVSSPTLHLEQQADGQSNLDPLLQGGERTASGSGGGPLRLEVGKVVLTKGTASYVLRGKDGTLEQSQITNLELLLDRLANGQPGKVTLSADANRTVTAKGLPTPKEGLAVRIGGTIDYALDPNLAPASAKGEIKLAVTQALGNLKDFSGFSATLACDLNASELREFALRFEQSGKKLGVIRAAGPVDLMKSELALKIDITDIDRNVLNLAGTLAGWDFLKTSINSTAQLDITRRGEVVHAKSNLQVSNFSVSRVGETTATPTVNLKLECELSVDLKEKSGILQVFSLQGTQATGPLMLAKLAQPMNLAWGGNVHGIKESSIPFSLTNLNLADWRLFLGSNITAGMVNAEGKVTARQDAKVLDLELASRVQDLGTVIGTNRISRVTTTFNASAQLTDFKQIQVTKFALEGTQAGQVFVSSTGSATLNTESKDSNIQVAMEANLPRTLGLLATPTIAATSGNLSINCLYTRKQDDQVVTASVVLSSFNGRSGDMKFQDYQMSLNGDLAIKGDQLSIRRGTLALQSGTDPGGTLDLGGRMNLSTRAGEFTFNIANLNQVGLRPFLEAALAPRKLVSAQIIGKGTAKLNPQDESVIQASAELAKLIVEDPVNRLPIAPFSIQFKVDASQKGSVLDLREVQLALAPTPRAKNQLQVKGRLDMGKTNPAPSTLSIAAESLDFTPMWNLFVTNQTAAAEPAPAATGAIGQNEPLPVELPIQDLKADLKIDRLYLSEVAVTNWIANLLVQKGTVTLKPFALNVNGAPLSLQGRANLTQPGYQYDLGWSVENLPLEPFVNTFTPNLKGQIVGNLYSLAQIKGAGVTGPNLQKNLQGNAIVSLTNMNLQVMGPRMKGFLTVMASVLRLDDLLKSPLNLFYLDLTAGQGKVNVKRLLTTSAAFYASSEGSITLAPSLTNSTLRLPVRFALSKGLAQQLKLVGGTPMPGTEYIELPPMVNVSGTVGNPKVETDKVRIAAILAGSLAGSTQGSTGDILKGVSNLLQGSTPRGTNAPTGGTNAPTGGTTGDILKGVSNLLQGGTSRNTNIIKTNAIAGTNATTGGTNAPAQRSPLDMIKDLIPPKKQ